MGSAEIIRRTDQIDTMLQRERSACQRAASACRRGQALTNVAFSRSM